MEKLSLVALISGRGSNLRAIIDAADPLVEVRAVISNHSHAKGLIHAQQVGIATEVLDHTQFKSQLDFDIALQVHIDHYQPKLVILAGFMRILSPEFVTHYQGRLLNIHPSLLPAFRGLHTHKRVLESGAKEHGASVHFVTENLDAGPVIIQARVLVFPNDDEKSLAARVLQEEHRIYPQAIHWFAQGRLQLHSQRALLDGKPITFAEEN
jgi:phosphoribosylglycinamide formyltransferase-1